MKLTDKEVQELQEKIVTEHHIPTTAAFSSNIYATFWLIDGMKYTMYKTIGHDGVEVYKKDGSLP